MGAFPTFQRLVEDSLAFDLCVWKYQRVLRIDFEGCPGIFLGSFQDRLWWCMFDLSLHGIQDFWILDLGFRILPRSFKDRIQSSDMLSGLPRILWSS